MIVQQNGEIFMVYKNAELHNVESIVKNDDGSVSWLRVPKYVYNAIESESGKAMAESSTGVEIRFVIKSGNAVIRMRTKTGDGIFHVYRGGIQGGWQDHEMHRIVTTEPAAYEISVSQSPEKLKKMSEMSGYDWDGNVIRIIFDRGTFEIIDIVGDIEPPSKSSTPQKTILAYGSSITHGSNSIDRSHSWAAVLAHNLNMDLRNLGMAGSCYLEPEFAEYIAFEGEMGKWDIATLELGINVLDWSDRKISDRVANMINTVAGRNPDKKVFVISPLFHCGDYFDEVKSADKWRRLIKHEVEQCDLENVIYINGLDLLGDMAGISADFIHPNIYGIAQIATKMTEIVVKTFE